MHPQDFVTADAQLLFGDSLLRLPSLPDSSIDCIVSDPPYRTIRGGKLKDGAKRPSGILAANNGKIFQFNDIEPAQYMAELYRVLKPGGDCYLMTNNLTLQKLLGAASAAGFAFHGMLAWQKNNATPSRWYMADAEWTCYFYRPPARPINDPAAKRIFACDNPRGAKRHPTEKPVALMRHYIENSTGPGERVLDPFMGAGATAVACAESGRRFVGMEIDPVYFAAAVGRL